MVCPKKALDRPLKQHFDKKAQPKTIKKGDNILIKQKKTTTKPPFDLMPYKVLGVA